MEPLNLSDLSRALINASRREATQLKPPFDLEGLDWQNLDFLGWTDPKAQQRAYVFVPVDGEPLGAILRVTPAAKRQAMCGWCEDITEVSGVRMFTAKLAGPSGRKGNTVGTLLHADFTCSQHARRRPSSFEGQHDPSRFIEERVQNLQFNAEHFIRRVRGER